MHVSLYRSIQGQYEWMRDVKSVPMMNTISHLVEDQVIKHGLAVDFYAGFQRFSFFMRQVERYRRLAEVARRVYVFGIADVEPPVIPGVQFITLPPDSTLTKEWFLLVDTPHFWTTLATREVEGVDIATNGRKFDGIWTFDVDLVNRIALLISQVLERVYMPTVNRNYARQYEHISEINNRLMAHLEHTRLSERRRWRQVMAIQNAYSVLARHQPPVRVNGFPLYLLRDTAEVLQGLFGAADAAVAYRVNGRNEYTQIALEGVKPDTEVVVRPGQSPSGRAIEERAAVYVPDARRTRQTDVLLPRAATVLAVPIIGRERVHGVLTVGGAEPELWGEEDSQTVQVIATMLAGVLDQEEGRSLESGSAADRVRALEQAILKLRTPVGKLAELQQQLWAAGVLNAEQSELLTNIGRVTNQMSQALGVRGEK
jgi:DICT domain-containing protein/putative methionine-R-sulfoxide reductase with GAF domain